MMRKIKKRSFGRGSGVVLILTLWMVTVLSLIAYSLAFEMRLEARLTKLRKDNLMAYQLAKAGLAKGICDLKNDMVFDRSEDAQIFDAEGDVWKNPKDKTNIAMAGGTYSVRVIDEESYLNLNKVNPVVMTEAINYFLGEEQEEEAGKIAFSILDWRDSDDIPAKGGFTKEPEFYLEYIAEDMDIDIEEAESRLQYRLKNDYFNTVEELLECYGMTPDLFYGFDPEERKKEIMMRKHTGRKRDNLHVMNSSSESDSYQIDIPPEGLRDLLTVRSNGTVNVNTASEAVLTAIIAAAQINDPDPEELARAIIEFRRDGADEDIENDQAFRTLEELSQVEGLSGPLISRLQSLQPLTTVSSNFRIIAEGTYGNAHRTIEAVVRRSWENFMVNSEEEELDPNVKRRIRREDDKKDDTKINIESPTVRFVQIRER
ncbi:general secretion pathway protein GspK [Candidatus Sumerlaeota bacterium]|nr:general secretion pathway protein GspK [Candidatus Sumerlaeota bacterium]